MSEVNSVRLSVIAGALVTVMGACRGDQFGSAVPEIGLPSFAWGNPESEQCDLGGNFGPFEVDPANVCEQSTVNAWNSDAVLDLRLRWSPATFESPTSNPTCVVAFYEHRILSLTQFGSWLMDVRSSPDCESGGTAPPIESVTLHVRMIRELGGVVLHGYTGTCEESLPPGSCWEAALAMAEVRVHDEPTLCLDNPDPASGVFDNSEALCSAFDEQTLVQPLEEGSTINIRPVARFTSDECPELTCGFDSRSSSDSDGSIASRAWQFGDGVGTSTNAVASYTYAEPGTYLVRLFIRDNGGGVDIRKRHISVDLPESQTMSGPELQCTSALWEVWISCEWTGASPNHWTEVWRREKDDPSGWVLIEMVLPGESSYIDTSGSPGTRYVHRVRFNSFDEVGPWSNEEGTYAGECCDPFGP